MNAKYQIFVSSTYEDLRPQREQVIKACLEIGHIPVGMEMFSAADDEQWRIITRTIDESDYYVVITAHRYGSTVDGVSYTEKEYDYAIKSQVPVIGFIIDDAAPWPKELIDTDVPSMQALQAFKAKLRRKPVGFWSTADDLHGHFAIALMKLINTHPRPGWTRGSDSVSQAVTAELSRLSSENAELRETIGGLQGEIRSEEQEGIDRTFRALMKNSRVIRVRKKTAATWEATGTATLLDIFNALAPELMIEKSVEKASRSVALAIGKVPGSQLHLNYPIASNTLKRWLADFMALGLVEPSSRDHPNTDPGEYWTLTEYGRDIYTSLRRVVLERGAGETGEPAEPDGNESQTMDKASDSDHAQADAHHTGSSDQGANHASGA